MAARSRPKKSRTKRRDRIADAATDAAGDIILWGAKQIGHAINLSERQAFHLLQTGKLESARKVAGRHCASRRKLLKECGA
jgi:hypothetical protein